MEGKLNEVIEYIRNLAPAVWAILMKQVYSNAIVNAIASAIFIVTTIAFLQSIRFCIKKQEKDSYSGWEMGILFLAMGVFITSIISLVTLVSAFQYLFNPEFYAIQQIIQTIK